jgi:phosphoglycerate dehydrogenase-like enzyme
MGTIVITTDYLRPGDEVDSLLRADGHVTVHSPADGSPRHAALTELLRTADAALVASEPITRDMLGGAASLKVIARSGVGYDSIDVDAAIAHGIEVCNTPGANSNAVAELTMMFVLMCARKAAATTAAVRNGGWPRHDTREVRGSTVGVIGLGPSGRKVVELARAFGAEVMVTTRYPDDSLDVTYASLQDTAASADFLTLHPRPTADNAGLVDATLLARMKPTAYLINTARGYLVDESALAEAVASGRIAGAALDVVSSEPLSPDNPLRGIPGVVITSHLGGQTIEARAEASRVAAQDILRVLRGDRALNPVAEKS